ncbi:MAG TPA: 30S ribosomal protein S8 [Candidatus Norongarragalinales archaeon]|nr:30S ribosomal protein S8 [Candidatus Norongarragalinales archaeon]
MDTLANALNVISVSESKGHSTAHIIPASSLVREVLLVLQKSQYIGEFEFQDDGKSGSFVVQLIGRINRCGVVKPRFPAGKGNWEKYEQRYLPAKDVGVLIVSTSKGILTHTDAKAKNLGGRLLAFVY